MLKAALGALLVAGAFAIALFAGGSVMGAWDSYEAPPSSGRPSPESNPLPTAHRQKTRRKKASPARDAHWIRRANAICLEARRNAAATRQPRTAEEIEAFLAHGMKENRRWNKRFLRIGAPRGEAKRFRRLRGLFREDEALLSEFAAAARRRDGSAAIVLGEELLDLAERESSLMVSLGARECALPSDAI